MRQVRRDRLVRLDPWDLQALRVMSDRLVQLDLRVRLARTGHRELRVLRVTLAPRVLSALRVQWGLPV